MPCFYADGWPPTGAADLPYDYNALEPVVSAEIMKLHHSKHHQAYVTNLNVAEEQFLEATARGSVAGAQAAIPSLRWGGGGVCSGGRVGVV